MGEALKIVSFLKSLNKSKQWTILCVAESGDISSMKLSRNSLVIMGALAGISFFIAIVIIIVYAAVKVENLQLRSSLEAAKTEMNDTRGEKENLMAQLLISRGDIHPKRKGSQPSRKKPEPKKLTKEAEVAAQKVPPIDMRVKNFKLYKDPETNRVRYEFFLRNKQPRESATVISGYTFVLLKPAKGEPTSWRVAPKKALHEGRPTNFKKGQLFSIARFKVVRGYIADTESVNYWEEAVILVYSYSGKLVLEKVFAPERKLRPNPLKPTTGTSQQQPTTGTSQQQPTTGTSQPEASLPTQAPQSTEALD